MKEDKYIMRSRRSWGCIVILIITIVILSFIFVVIINADISIYLRKLSRLLLNIAILLLYFLYLVLRIIYVTRRVYIYADRIVIRYPFRFKRNIEIPLNTVDCVCLGTDNLDLDDENDSIGSYRKIYLLSGNKLWLYLEKSDYSNCDEMYNLLKEVFHLETRKGCIMLSESDEKQLRDEDYITLTDISNEERAAWAAKRRFRRKVDLTYIATLPKSTAKFKKLVLFAIRGLLITLAVCLLALILISLYEDVKNKDHYLPLLTAGTQLPKENYWVVDSVDVDEMSLVWKVEKYQSDKSNRIISWAFRVRGYDNLWVSKSILLNSNEDISTKKIETILRKTFGKRHRYIRSTDKDDLLMLKQAKANYYSNSYDSNSKEKSETILLICEENPMIYNTP